MISYEEAFKFGAVPPAVKVNIKAVEKLEGTERGSLNNASLRVVISRRERFQRRFPEQIVIQTGKELSVDEQIRNVVYQLKTIPHDQMLPLARSITTMYPEIMHQPVSRRRKIAEHFRQAFFPFYQLFKTGHHHIVGRKMTESAMVQGKNHVLGVVQMIPVVGLPVAVSRFAVETGITLNSHAPRMQMQILLPNKRRPVTLAEMPFLQAA